MNETDRLNEALSAVLDTDQGRQCFFWLLTLCGVYEDGFEMEAGLMSYRLGRQSVGKQIIARMNMIEGELYPRFLMQVARDQAHISSNENNKNRKDNHNE